MNEPLHPKAPEATTDPATTDPTAADPTEPAPEIVERLEAEQRLRSGASWFYWIAGLSLVNSVISLAEGGWSFLFGLGITQVIDAAALFMAEQSPDSALLIRGGAFVLSLLIAGISILFGWLAGRRQLWAFVIGGLLYLCDAGLLVLIQDWLGLAFHGWVLFALFRGYQAGRELRKWDKPDDPFAPPEPEASGFA